VEIQEDFSGWGDVTLFQDDVELVCDESFEGIYRLNRPFGTVMLRLSRAEDGHECAKHHLGEAGENFFLFKMRSKWQGPGRRVKRATSGYYIVIAPRGWKRDEALSGPPLISPEPVFVEEYESHFFYLASGYGERITFLTLNDERIEIETALSRFELKGNSLPDADSGMGRLFGEGQIRVCALDEEDWNAIKVLVVGEQGSRRKRWYMQFNPKPGSRDQNLPEQLSKHGSGWYFLGFYDVEDNLVESLDFRFAPGLENIAVAQHPPLPTSTGHADVNVNILHKPNLSISLADQPGVELVTAREDQRTIITLPPDPGYDETRWFIGPTDGLMVEMTIQTERVWWAIGEIVGAPDSWTDKQLTVSRDSFSASSNAALWLRLPRPRWVSEVKAGFEHWRSRRYPVEVERRELAIPLREFADSAEFENRAETATFKVWLELDGRESFEGLAAVLPGDGASREVTTSEEMKGAQRLPDEESFVIDRGMQGQCPPSARVYSRGAGRWRRGRGFSKGEVRGAELLSLGGIPFDKRRKSRHQINVEMLVKWRQGNDRSPVLLKHSAATRSE